mgnify:CR=1 FL=1
MKIVKNGRLFGKLNIEYLFGKKAVVVFSVIAVVFVFLTAMFTQETME